MPKIDLDKTEGRIKAETVTEYLEDFYKKVSLSFSTLYKGSDTDLLSSYSSLSRVDCRFSKLKHSRV